MPGTSFAEDPVSRNFLAGIASNKLEGKEMTTTDLRGFVAGLALLAAAAVPGVAAAQSTWNLGSSACGTGGGTTYSYLSCSTGSPSETATMHAFGNSGAGTTFAQGNLANWDPSGFGAYGPSDSASSPYHAFDSTLPSGSTELMLISFGPYKVSLTSVAIGWYSGDADVSILRWDGANVSDAKTLVSGKTTAELLSSGWTLVGSQDLDALGANFDNPNTTGNTLDAYKSTINLGTKVSSYWIISTYFGSTSGNLDAGNDAFKILNFAANVCTAGTYTGGNGGNGGTCGGTQTNVPEPATMALLGVALLGATATRRRGRGKA